jgi:hypothetical protein
MFTKLRHLTEAEVHATAHASALRDQIASQEHVMILGCPAAIHAKAILRCEASGNNWLSVFGGTRWRGHWKEMLDFNVAPAVMLATVRRIVNVHIANPEVAQRLVQLWQASVAKQTITAIGNGKSPERARQAVMRQSTATLLNHIFLTAAERCVYEDLYPKCKTRECSFEQMDAQGLDQCGLVLFHPRSTRLDARCHNPKP